MATKGCPPRGTFPGVNFMTPDVLMHYRLADGAWAELSTGRGMSGPLFGVTVRDPADPSNPQSERSRCFHSRAAAEDFISQDCPRSNT